MKILRRIWRWIKSLFQKEEEPETLPDGREDLNLLMNDWYGALWDDHVRQQTINIQKKISKTRPKDPL